MRSPAHCTSCWASVGAGFSCPPSCQPIPGHCRVRQSGHFLETGSLHPPPAALRRFPRPREGQSPSPTHFFVTQHRRGGRPCPPAILTKTLVGRGPCAPPLPRTSCEVSLRGQCEHWPWQSVSPVPKAPCVRGGGAKRQKCRHPRTPLNFPLTIPTHSSYTVYRRLSIGLSAFGGLVDVGM